MLSFLTIHFEIRYESIPNEISHDLRNKFILIFQKIELLINI